jgi:phosphopantothenate synthetase
MASITIVDEISRVAKNMLKLIENNDLPDIEIEFNNNKNLQTSVNIIAGNYRAV